MVGFVVVVVVVAWTMLGRGGAGGWAGACMGSGGGLGFTGAPGDIMELIGDGEELTSTGAAVATGTLTKV